jgi:hypothetical protein
VRDEDSIWEIGSSEQGQAQRCVMGPEIKSGRLAAGICHHCGAVFVEQLSRDVCPPIEGESPHRLVQRATAEDASEYGESELEQRGRHHLQSDVAACGGAWWRVAVRDDMCWCVVARGAT